MKHLRSKPPSKFSNLSILVFILLAVLVFSYLSLFNTEINASLTVCKSGTLILQDENGIRISVADLEIYFNATNGGEITEYFDLLLDPARSNNLVNMEWKPYYNLMPLFTSLFYNPYKGLVLSTGGDPSATTRLIEKTTEHAILQTSARLMSLAGQVGKDVGGNPIYVNSTWIIRNNGLISVERTFSVATYTVVPSGWRWYPFYFTRKNGFGDNGTFNMFNTTFTYASVVNHSSYVNEFQSYPVIPIDEHHVFGMGIPFSNTNLGGDGTHNLMIAYQYDELINVTEWRSDNYHSTRNIVTETGGVHEASQPIYFQTHTYHMLINLTHQPADEASFQDFARYFADNPSIGSIMKCSIGTNKDVYSPGDYYAFQVNGTSFYDLTEIKAKLTARNSSNQTIYQKEYGPANTTSGATFKITVLSGTIPTTPTPGNYTISFEIFSPFGIVIASDAKTITINTS
jgi:hypothetical protein